MDNENKVELWCWAFARKNEKLNDEKKKEIKSRANIVRHSVGYPCKSDENKYNVVYFSLKVMRLQREPICHLLINVYVYLPLRSMIIWTILKLFCYCGSTIKCEINRYFTNDGQVIIHCKKTLQWTNKVLLLYSSRCRKIPYNRGKSVLIH